jgi:serine/threonine protein kinase
MKMIGWPTLKMAPMNEALFNQLRRRSQVLEADAFGEKVLQLEDGTFLKIFRRKRLLSSATFIPYSVRFVHNAKKLRSLGILCPKPIQLYQMNRPGRSVVHYHPVPGNPLRALLKFPEEPEKIHLRYKLGKFVAELHARGIYFRSLHLGNIILSPDGRFGLIDISDLKFFTPPLDTKKRKRNFRHFLRIDADRKWFERDPEKLFYLGYYEKFDSNWIQNLIQAK